MNRFLTSLSFVVVLAGVPFAALAQNKTEPADSLRIVGIKLPLAADRLVDVDDVRPLAALARKSLGAGEDLYVGDVEVILYRAESFDLAAQCAALTKALEASGYVVKESKGEGLITFRAKSSKREFGGTWVTVKGGAILNVAPVYEDETVRTMAKLEYQRADLSLLSSTVLPSGTIRYAKEEAVEQESEALTTILSNAKLTVAQREFLLWQEKEYRPEAARAAVKKGLEAAGYEVTEQEKGGKMMLFALKKADQSFALIGQYSSADGVYSLVWAIAKQKE